MIVIGTGTVSEQWSKQKIHFQRRKRERELNASSVVTRKSFDLIHCTRFTHFSLCDFSVYVTRVAREYRFCKTFLHPLQNDFCLNFVLSHRTSRNTHDLSTFYTLWMRRWMSSNIEFIHSRSGYLHNDFSERKSVCAKNPAYECCLELEDEIDSLVWCAQSREHTLLVWCVEGKCDRLFVGCF